MPRWRTTLYSSFVNFLLFNLFFNIKVEEILQIIVKILFHFGVKSYSSLIITDQNKVIAWKTWEKTTGNQVSILPASRWKKKLKKFRGKQTKKIQDSPAQPTTCWVGPPMLPFSFRLVNASKVKATQQQFAFFFSFLQGFTINIEMIHQNALHRSLNIASHFFHPFFGSSATRKSQVEQRRRSMKQTIAQPCDHELEVSEMMEVVCPSENQFPEIYLVTSFQDDLYRWYWEFFVCLR